MSDNCEILPWDYFLTNYERDLLQLTIEDAIQKYPNISPKQIDSDLIQLVESIGLSMNKIRELIGLESHSSRYSGAKIP